MIHCEVPQDKEWEWTKAFEQSIRKWNQNLPVWCRKAIAASDDPPKAKHVRRIILALIRDPHVTLMSIFNELFSGEEWKTDIRMVVKAYYILLVCSQFSENFPNAADLIQSSKKINMILSKAPNQQEFSAYSGIQQSLSRVLEAKMAFHYKNTNISGNLCVNGEMTESLKLLFLDYAKVVVGEFKNIVSHTYSCKYFLGTTLVQPIADEASSIYKILKYYKYSPEQIENYVKDIESNLKLIETMPYLDTAVISPALDEDIQPNHPRYPLQVELQ